MMEIVRDDVATLGQYLVSGLWCCGISQPAECQAALSQVKVPVHSYVTAVV
jgi:hypothetical protein